MSRSKLRWLLLLASLGTGCARTQVPEDTWLYVPNTAYFEVTHYRPTEGGFSLEVALDNLGHVALLVSVAELECGRGDQTGRVIGPAHGAGRVLAVLPGMRQPYALGCEVGGEGEVWLRVVRLWSNPSHDKRTGEEVLAKQLEWRFSPSP